MIGSNGRRTHRADQVPASSTEYQRFKSEYFSGADVRIYFGDIWLDEITNLQFTLQEQVSPIFGYASYTWDRVARGTRHIQGSFVINFKESYYLHSALNSLRSELKDPSTAIDLWEEKQWTKGISTDHLMGEKFEEVADEFEKSLWGEGQKAASARNRVNKSSYFSSEHNDAELDQNGFNILISYGPRTENGGGGVSTTAHSLIGVQLTGCGQIIGGDGQPIQEQYSFIAKDLDGFIGQK